MAKITKTQQRELDRQAYLAKRTAEKIEEIRKRHHRFLASRVLVVSETGWPRAVPLPGETADEANARMQWFHEDERGRLCLSVVDEVCRAKNNVCASLEAMEGRVKDARTSFERNHSFWDTMSSAVKLDTAVALWKALTESASRVLRSTNVVCDAINDAPTYRAAHLRVKIDRGSINQFLVLVDGECVASFGEEEIDENGDTPELQAWLTLDAHVSRLVNGR